MKRPYSNDASDCIQSAPKRSCLVRDDSRIALDRKTGYNGYLQETPGSAKGRLTQLKRLRQFVAHVARNGISQGTTKWLQEKSGTIGGSSIASISSADKPFSNLFTLIGEKSKLQPFVETPAVSFGKVFECVARAGAAEICQCVVFGDKIFYDKMKPQGVVYSPDSVGVVSAQNMSRAARTYTLPPVLDPNAEPNPASAVIAKNDMTETNATRFVAETDVAQTGSQANASTLLRNENAGENPGSEDSEMPSFVSPEISEALKQLCKTKGQPLRDARKKDTNRESTEKTWKRLEDPRLPPYRRVLFEFKCPFSRQASSEPYSPYVAQVKTGLAVLGDGQELEEGILMQYYFCVPAIDPHWRHTFPRHLAEGRCRLFADADCAALQKLIDARLKATRLSARDNDGGDGDGGGDNDSHISIRPLQNAAELDWTNCQRADFESLLLLASSEFIPATREGEDPPPVIRFEFEVKFWRESAQAYVKVPCEGIPECTNGKRFCFGYFDWTLQYLTATRVEKEPNFIKDKLSLIREVLDVCTNCCKVEDMEERKKYASSEVFRIIRSRMHIYYPGSNGANLKPIGRLVVVSHTPRKRNLETATEFSKETIHPGLSERGIEEKGNKLTQNGEEAVAIT